MCGFMDDWILLLTKQKNTHYFIIVDHWTRHKRDTSNSWNTTSVNFESIYVAVVGNDLIYEYIQYFQLDAFGMYYSCNVDEYTHTVHKFIYVYYFFSNLDLYK